MSLPTQQDPSPADPSAALTDELARRYLVRVIAYARRMSRRLPPHITLNDLISAGLMGVVEGFLRFDPGRAETLDAYLDHRIRGALLDELRRADPLTRTQRRFARKLGSASRAASSQPGGPSEESLAGTLRLSVDGLRARVSRMHVSTAIASPDCAERVEDEAPAPDDAMAATQERRLLAHATEALPVREREVLRLHYEEEQTFREISGRFGVSESRISQLHSRALLTLRTALTA